MPAAGIALGTARGGAPRPDPDALAFAATSGATDIAALSKFVKGVKKLGLWSNMVCWPMRSGQNKGSGTTVYSLGGLGVYNGTMVNSPTWQASGITFTRTLTQHLTTTLQLSGTQNCTFFTANSTNDDGGGSGGIIHLMGTRASSVTTTTCVTSADDGLGAVDSTFLIAAPARIFPRPSVNPYSSTHVFEPNTPLTRVALNGGTYTSSAATSSPLGGTQASLVIGHTGTVLGNRGFNGTMHFVAVFAATSMSVSDSTALHALLKDTLLNGLGLP